MKASKLEQSPRQLGGKKDPHEPLLRSRHWVFQPRTAAGYKISGKQMKTDAISLNKYDKARNNYLIHF